MENPLRAGAARRGRGGQRPPQGCKGLRPYAGPPEGGGEAGGLRRVVRGRAPTRGRPKGAGRPEASAGL